MTTNAARVEVDPECPAGSLGKAMGRLSGQEALLLDFGEVLRIDAAAVKALEELAQAAERQGVTITLSSVKTPIYRVLKVLKLERKFTILP